jgi:hypothetical protein
LVYAFATGDSRSPRALRTTVGILVVSIAVAWVLGAIVRVNGTEVLVGFIVCVGLAAGSAWIVCARLMTRLVLRSDSLELVSPRRRRHVWHGEISTWAYRSPTASPGAGFRITSQTGKVLEIPPLLGRGRVPRAMVRAATERAHAGVTARKKILIVDDEPAIADTFHSTFDSLQANASDALPRCSRRRSISPALTAPASINQ